MSYSRQRAIALNAATIAEVLTVAGYSRLLQKLTASQRQQLQRYLDALVVDPVVRAEANALYRKGTTTYGQISVMDPAIKRKAEKVMREFIPVSKSDDRVRLNAAQLLDDATFTATTDNPDEAEFLDRARTILLERGVWLRLTPRMVRSGDDPSQWVSDPRQYEVWLSLGANGDHIPTKSGRIDRDALMNTRLFGVGYYTNVDKGPVQRALHREMDRLWAEIESGMEQHSIISRIRGSAAIGVVAISDALGGADFPGFEIWEGPAKLVTRAREINNAGRIYSSRALLIVAAIATRNAASVLASAMEDSLSGAQSTVRVLKVARTAGQIAEAALIVTGVGAVAIRALSVRGAVAAGEVSTEVLMEREVAKLAARDAELANELRGVRVVKMPKGTVAGKAARAGGRGKFARHEIGTGFHVW